MSARASRYQQRQPFFLLLDAPWLQLLPLGPSCLPGHNELAGSQSSAAAGMPKLTFAAAPTSAPWAVLFKQL
jgi:hypothetical protein